MTRYALALVLALAPLAAGAADTAPQPPPKPSFDCAKAKGRVRLMICGDYKLAALDVEEDALLHRALRKSAQPEAVGADQDVWLGQRDACSSAPCVAAAYRRRIGELHEWSN